MMTMIVEAKAGDGGLVAALAHRLWPHDNEEDLRILYERLLSATENGAVFLASTTNGPSVLPNVSCGGIMWKARRVLPSAIWKAYGWNRLFAGRALPAVCCKNVRNGPRKRMRRICFRL